MLSPLPRPIAAYIQAANDHDSAAFAGTFSEDAVVADDGHEHRGRAAIQAWNEQNVREYAPSMAVAEVQQQEEKTAVTARVSGTFDGSPLLFRYTFTLAGDEISSLSIKHIG
jgi:uncharacterized protein (TIGR02246 family)